MFYDSLFVIITLHSFIIVFFLMRVINDYFIALFQLDYVEITCVG